MNDKFKKFQIRNMIIKKRIKNNRKLEKKLKESSFH